MAYSNWGAFVFKDGIRQRDKEDVPVFGDPDVEAAPSGARIFVNLMKQQGEHAEREWHHHCHHAVLGSGRVRLCGYKSTPELYLADAAGHVQRLDIVHYRIDRDVRPEAWEWHESHGIVGEIEGHKFIATPFEDPERVQLSLAEPDGTLWTSQCGMGIGAGHQDE